MGICNNVNLIKLLQPNRICTNIGINNVQDKLNMKRYLNARKGFLFCFLCEKKFWTKPNNLRKGD